MTELLTIRGLCCERDDRVLFSALDLSVHEGEVVQILGANGSGKSTLLRVLSGLSSDFSGDILWKGQLLASQRNDYLQQLFYLGHAPAIKKTLSPMENLRWFCASQGQGDDDTILAALDRFNLGGYDDIPCYQMSAGQQRRVSLARLCLSPAQLWILDEPFTALDRHGVAMLEHFLAEHARQGGAVLLTTHHELNMDCALRYLSLDNTLPAPTRERADA